MVDLPEDRDRKLLPAVLVSTVINARFFVVSSGEFMSCVLITRVAFRAVLSVKIHSFQNQTGLL